MLFNLKVAVLRTRQPQRRIACDAGLTENRFSEIVNGWITLTVDERTAIARAMGVSPDDAAALFDLTDDAVMTTQGQR